MAAIVAYEKLDGDEGTSVIVDGDASTHLEFEQVFKEEQRHIQEMLGQRVPEGRRDVSFALALSGGGMRAAAFQCGVLWQLAEQGRLKDVEYITAVSGGAYIAMAFASHCMDEFEKQPPRGGDVDQWYKRVVSKTIVRMQNNCGDFVRDFVRSGCGPPEDNSGCTSLPRIFDVPILIGTLVATMLVNPIFVFICFFVPIAMMTEEFFGQAMRDSFCAASTMRQGVPEWFVKFQEDSAFGGVLTVALYSFIASIVFGMMKQFAPYCTDPIKTAEKGERVELPIGFLLTHGLYSFALRLTVCAGFYAVFLVSVLTGQVLSFRMEHGSLQLQGTYCKDPTGNWQYPEGCLQSGGCLPHLLWHLAYVFLIILLFSVAVLPYFGAYVLDLISSLIGPSLILLVSSRLTQFRVFGVLTQQDFLNGHPFDLADWNWFTHWVLLLSLVLLPFYNEFRCVLHFYYKRCLFRNFFANGEDKAIIDLAKCPYCPFTIVTGTSSDYKPPIGQDGDVISELSFSSLHVGSVETGYLQQSPFRTLGNCTALSAAGCIDAVALTLSNLLTMRFWLEALNLCWGNYIIFEDDHGPLSEFVLNAVPKHYRNAVHQFLRRLPGNAIVWSVWCLFFLGCFFEDRQYYIAALVLFGIMLFISMLSFGPEEQSCGRNILHLLRMLANNISMSPWVRQLHQATQFCYRGERPPPMLYVTDGGCCDCTTLLQLCMRRQERILLVLAASDPEDDLGVLRTAIGIVKREGWACFYSPIDPRQDIDACLQQFKDDKSLEHLHLGIRYPKIRTSSKVEDEKFGHLYIVKNRLCTRSATDIEPHMTEQEVMGEAEKGMGQFPENVQPFNPEDWGEQKTTDLGPFCCCDCSHASSWTNCGRKFPHGSFSNFMYMTPMWCNSLARLAFDMSPEAIQEVLKPEQGEGWEQHVALRKVRAQGKRMFGSRA